MFSFSFPAPLRLVRSPRLVLSAAAFFLAGISGLRATTAPLAIPYPGIDPGTVGTTYSKSYAATGGKTPYKWSVSAGTLAPGLTVSTAGVISGKPTKAGDYDFSLRVTDAAGSTVTVAEDLWIGAAAAAPAPTPARNLRRETLLFMNVLKLSTFFSPCRFVCRSD